MGIFPELLKYVSVKPLDMDNYGPISLLKILSKVDETTVYHTLNHHLQINNILVAKQYGFRKGLNRKCSLYTYR